MCVCVYIYMCMYVCICASIRMTYGCFSWYLKPAEVCYHHSYCIVRHNIVLYRTAIYQESLILLYIRVPMWIYACICISMHLYVCIRVCAMTYMLHEVRILFRTGNYVHIIWKVPNVCISCIAASLCLISFIFLYQSRVVLFYHYCYYHYYYYHYYYFIMFLFPCLVVKFHFQSVTWQELINLVRFLAPFAPFLFSFEWTIFVLLCVISCFSPWMAQIHFNALIHVVGDFYFENELSRWKSNTREMRYIMWLHGPSNREHQKRNFGCMCHVLVNPCDSLCNRKQ